MSWPVYNLPVRVVRLFCAEWRPSNQALEHDSANTPPITSEVVTFAAEDLRRNVIWSTDCRVCQLSPRLTPSVDLVAVGDCKLDLVDGDRISVLLDGFGSSLGHELLIIRG